MYLGYHTLLRDLRKSDERNKALALEYHVLDTSAPMAILATVTIDSHRSLFSFLSFLHWVQIKLVVNQKPGCCSFFPLIWMVLFLTFILLLLLSLNERKCTFFLPFILLMWAYYALESGGGKISTAMQLSLLLNSSCSTAFPALSPEWIHIAAHTLQGRADLMSKTAIVWRSLIIFSIKRHYLLNTWVNF